MILFNTFWLLCHKKVVTLQRFYVMYRAYRCVRTRFFSRHLRMLIVAFTDAKRRN